MNIKTQAKLTAAFLLSEGSGQISREAVIVIAGDALPSGQLLGIVTATGKYAPYNNAANDGREVAAGVLYAPLAESDADRDAVAIVRLAEVRTDDLAGLDVAAWADLEARNIILR